MGGRGAAVRPAGGRRAWEATTERLSKDKRFAASRNQRPSTVQANRTEGKAALAFALAVAGAPAPVTTPACRLHQLGVLNNLASTVKTTARAGPVVYLRAPAVSALHDFGILEAVVVLRAPLSRARFRMPAFGIGHGSKKSKRNQVREKRPGERANHRCSMSAGHARPPSEDRWRLPTPPHRPRHQRWSAALHPPRPGPRGAAGAQAATCHGRPR